MAAIVAAVRYRHPAVWIPAGGLALAFLLVSLLAPWVLRSFNLLCFRFSMLLSLSDEILQIATDYLGEVPLLMSPRPWWTRAQGPNAELKRTQLYHRGRPKVV
jgi:hypothetical protein